MGKRAYKYRIYPDESQKVLLNKTFGCVRVVWNDSVARFNEYEKDVSHPWYPPQKQLKFVYPWMNEVSAAALQQKQRDFSEFKAQFFNKNRKTKLGRPKLKKKGKRDSFRLPNQKFKVLNHGFKLEKIGAVKAMIDRPIPKESKILSATVSKDRVGAFYISVLFEVKDLPASAPAEAIGIDMGLTHFAILSNGEKIENPKFLRENQARIKKSHKNLSRKQKGSRRRAKARLRLARDYRKVSRRREHFQNVVSTTLSRRFSDVTVETLDVQKMMKNRKLAFAIADVGWSSFIQKLSYKTRVNKAEAFFPSSKTCSACGAINNELKLSDRDWTCSCGAVHDRDVNAAKNLAAQGVACAIRTQRIHKTSPQGGAETVEASKKTFKNDFHD